MKSTDQCRLATRVFFLSLLLCASGVPAAYADWPSQERMNKINSWFDNIHVGDMQKPGEIQVPKGIQAIKQFKENCKQRLVVNADTLFEFDKSTLTKDAEETLKVLGPMIMQLGKHPVQVEGHTDAVGSIEYNKTLSEKRAQTVKAWLVAHKFAPPAANTFGYGKSNPIAPNFKPDGSDNPDGRRRNRRVEIVVNTCETLTAAQWNAPPKPPAPPSQASLNAEWLPYADLYTADQINAAFVRARVTPYDDPKFYFEVLVPKDWEGRPVTVSKDEMAGDSQHMVPMAEMAPPGSKDLVLQTAYMRVPEDVTLERFVTTYADKAGAKIVARQKGEFNKRTVEDALLKLAAPESGNMLTRFTASRRGEFVFVVAVSTKESEYQKWKRIFGAAAVSFDPSGK